MTARDELDRLCKAYRTKPPTLQRELAEREREIWLAAKPVITEAERVDGMAAWFRKRFGNILMAYQHRSSLLSAGAASDPLWAALDSHELTLPEAGQMLIDAKALGDKPGELFLSVQMVLEERFGKRAAAPAKPKVVVKPRVEPPKPRPKASPPSPAPASNGKKPRAVRAHAEDVSREFRAKIRDAAIVALRDFFAERTETMDEHFVNRARTSFVEWVETGVSNFLYDVQRARREGERSKLARIGQVRFSQACELLGIFKIAGKRVVFGKALDEKGYKELFKLTRERHHQRSRSLHPDRIQGREPTAAELAEYQAVQDARTVIEDYIHQMTESKGTVT